jgi:hypothetical protein
MRPGAVTARLQHVARLLADRGFVAKGVDMSPRAITARLQTLGALSDMCRRLGQVRGLTPLVPAPARRP